MTQNDFDKKFDYSLKTNRLNWSILISIFNAYPNEFRNYAYKHNKLLMITEGLEKCAGCVWNDNVHYADCNNCADCTWHEYYHN